VNEEVSREITGEDDGKNQGVVEFAAFTASHTDTVSKIIDCY